LRGSAVPALSDIQAVDIQPADIQPADIEVLEIADTDPAPLRSDGASDVRRILS
jgi:hypothetical protein